MSYNCEGPCDKSLSWTSIDSYNDETVYWQNIENAFRCKALKKMCKTEFLLTPIIIENKECYSTKSEKFIVHLDPCHDILQVYDSNKLIYDIPEANSLILERQELVENIIKLKDKIKDLQKNVYHLSAICNLDTNIKKLLLQYTEELSINKDIIKNNEERIISIKKELTNTFVDFISKNDCA
jgi:hypothetical protein